MEHQTIWHLHCVDEVEVVGVVSFELVACAEHNERADLLLLCVIAQMKISSPWAPAERTRVPAGNSIFWVLSGRSLYL